MNYFNATIQASPAKTLVWWDYDQWFAALANYQKEGSAFGTTSKTFNCGSFLRLP